MEIRYERPLPDLTFLVRAPLKMDLGEGQEAWVEAWCTDGLRPPEGLAGESGEVRLTIPFHGFDITFPVRLKRDPEVNLMRFEGLGAREQRVLNHFYREIVTGRAVTMERMITAMDTPVERVPMHQTPAEAAETTARSLPRSVRAAAVLALYAGLIALLYQPVLSPVWRQAETLMQGVEQVAMATPTRSSALDGVRDGMSDGVGSGVAPGTAAWVSDQAPLGPVEGDRGTADPIVTGQIAAGRVATGQHAAERTAPGAASPHLGMPEVVRPEAVRPVRPSLGQGAADQTGAGHGSTGQGTGQGTGQSMGLGMLSQGLRMQDTGYRP